MSKNSQDNITWPKKFGTGPVFITAICTILGAILFLRFGYAVGTIGFWGVIMVIILGHMVTIPTAVSLAEIATNKKVEGGGEYFMISRSFGLNIGATVGILLYLSKAISVAFYVIAFTEAFEPLFDWVKMNYELELPRQVISLPAMAILAVLILLRGANVGIKALYVVAVILFISLALFFMGDTDFHTNGDFFEIPSGMKNSAEFFTVFAIIFPAFTGITAGVGLSGDLKDPSRAIPLGTLLATFIGMIIYIGVVRKLSISASPDDLLNKQLIMGEIALGGAFIIPLGLAASTISSSLGSILVAPRILHAMAHDGAFPLGSLNRFLDYQDPKNNEPVNASFVTVIIAFVFVALGNVNAVARIISMFFMMTYGALNLISFLNHFGAHPSYRPSFKSRWYVSLVGFVLSVWLMFKMDAAYAFWSLVMLALVYFYNERYRKERQGMAALFRGAFFQINRILQVFLQNARRSVSRDPWRPSVICVSSTLLSKSKALEVVSWISYRYGFGTYIYLKKGYFSRANKEESELILQHMIQKSKTIKSKVYFQTLVSPSYTTAIAQVIQLPGITGMPNNMFLFEFDKEKREGIKPIAENFNLVKAGDFDICVFGYSNQRIHYEGGIQIWIKSTDDKNSGLMILLGFIISAHPDWKKGPISVFEICKKGETEQTQEKLRRLIGEGQFPISIKNINIVTLEENQTIRDVICERAADAGLTILGFRAERIKHDSESVFYGYESIGDVLFVNSREEKSTETEYI